MIDIPFPYYFSMANPVAVSVAVPQNNQDFVFYDLGNNFAPVYNHYLYFTTSEKAQFETIPANNPMTKSFVDTQTSRYLSSPVVADTQISYQIGDPYIDVSFGECIYNQSCSDIIITHHLEMQDGSAAPSFLQFSNALFKMRIQSNLAANAGAFNLRVKCKLQDGFTSYSDFTLTTTYTGSGGTDTGGNGTDTGGNDGGNSGGGENNGGGNQNSIFDFEPNFPPKFLKPLLPKWILNAGSKGNLTLPETYDPNTQDKVKISITFVLDKYTPYFYIDQNAFLVFNAGFFQLGDIECIVTLTDTNKNPLRTNYKLIISILQSPFGPMDNSNVQTLDHNKTNNTGPIKLQVQNSNQLSIDEIT